MLNKIANRFSAVRYHLLAVIILFFMAMGAMIGSFEECVPLVPIVVALAINLGWDALTGMGMSLLAVGCGFASGVCNPFTIGVAQQLAGLPYLGYLNWFFPIGDAITITAAWLTVIGTWYSWQVLLRWLKVIGD